MKFKATVTAEVPKYLKAEVEVEADTRAEAEMIIRQKYKDDELDFDDGKASWDKGVIDNIEFEGEDREESVTGKATKEWQVLHNLKCEYCDNDLTHDDQVNIEFVTGTGRWFGPGQVRSDNRLTANNESNDLALGAGLHSCSRCAACGEMLEELAEDQN